MVGKNQKKIVFVLIPAVIVIWGVIAIQINVALSNNSNVVSKSKIPKAAVKEISNLQLDLNYPEPFLIKEAKIIRRPAIAQNESKSKKANTNRVKTKPVVKEVKQEKPWPQIRYKGLIANLSTGSKSVILECNKQVEIVKVGDAWNDFKVNDCRPDSVLLQYDGKEKWLKKN